MSLTRWAKRSPEKYEMVLLAVIIVILLNAYYRDQPNAVPVSKSSDVAIAASPEVKAFLKMTRWAEGTAGEDGYRTMYGGAKFESFDDHPRKIQTTYYTDKDGIERVFNASNCAGAYQICSPTFDRFSAKLGIKDFSPKSQDAMAIELIKSRGAYEFVQQGNTQKAVEVLCPEWASFPCSDKNIGYYPNGQTVKPMNALLGRYKEYFANSSEPEVAK